MRYRINNRKVGQQLLIDLGFSIGQLWLFDKMGWNIRITQDSDNQTRISTILLLSFLAITSANVRLEQKKYIPGKVLGYGK